MKTKKYNKITFCMLIIGVLIVGTFSIFASEGANIVVGQASALPGERITIPVRLNINPGLAGMILDIEYDSTRLRIDESREISRGMSLLGLTYIGVTQDTFARNPFRAVWFGTRNDTSTGELLNIQFTILDNAPFGDAFIRVSIDEENPFDIDGNPVKMTVHQGHITVLGSDGNTPKLGDTQTNAPAIPSESTPPTELTISNDPAQHSRLTTPNVVDTTETLLPIAEATHQRLVMPHTVSTAILPETFVIQRLNLKTGDFEIIKKCAFDREIEAMRFLGILGDSHFVVANPVNFRDVELGRWYHSAITFVAARELFSGVGNNLFEPQNNMTRAMFVTVLARLDGANLDAFASAPFRDVNISHWYGRSIAWAQDIGVICQGILSNAEAGLFLPSDNITREEMAVIFANYLSIRDFPIDSTENQLFSDIEQANDWARAAIQAMREYSIISGVGNNNFNPQGKATRAEVAQIFTNMVWAIIGGGL